MIYSIHSIHSLKFEESSRVCWNGGQELFKLDGSTECTCALGFEGPECRTIVPCAQFNPCIVNQGDCKRTPLLECDCYSGFSGKYC